ncbi:MAG: NAD-dependent epimerase/dehydratase family protein [SAR202 cluster bacterium]|nr:NAD-dependent epimerase/dehydratase family protein [SAR202 cluster bacterium]
MNVLIIGGTQYFGKVAVQKLLKRGDRVTLYTRGNTKPDFWKDVDHITGDRTDYADFAKKLKGKKFDAVIDNQAYKTEDVKSVVETMKGNVGKYVVATTVSIYGGPGHAIEWRDYARRDRPLWVDEFIDLSRHCPMKEDDVDLGKVDWEYVKETHEYGQGKRMIEKYLSGTKGFPWVVMRVPATLGPEDPSLRFWWYQQRIQDGKEIVLRDGGTNVFRLGFRDDVADALIDAADSPKTAGNIYNICQLEINSLRRLIESIARAAGKPLNVVPVPGEVAEAKSSLPWQDWAFDPFSRPRSYVMAVEKARRDFNLRFTPMDAWVKQTVDWYRANPPKKDSAHYDKRGEEVRLARWWRDEYAKLLK